MDAFSLLRDETRAGILRELTAAQQETPRDPGLSFSSLRRRVGAHDSSNFNYHLEKLRDAYVTQEDEEYRLTPSGQRLAALASESETVEPRTIALDSSCPYCGQSLSLTHADDVLELSCPADHPIRMLVPDSARRGRDDESLRALAATLVHHWMGLAVDEVCPVCYGHLPTSLVGTEDESMPAVAFGVCEHCGAPASLSPGMCALQHPDVREFYADYGLDFHATPLWEHDIVRGEAVTIVEDGRDDREEDSSVETTAGEPLGAAVTTELSGERLRVRLDRDASVTTVERSDVREGVSE